MSYRLPAAVPALVLIPCAFLLTSGPVVGQGFWREDAPKIPMAPTWVAEKAELPPYDPPRTPDGVPDLQGFWGGAGGDGLSYLEDHEFVDVTTPAQETFISDPPDGKVPYTPWGLAKRNEILAGLGRGWPGESPERLYSSPAAYCQYFMPRFSFSALEIIQRPGAVIMLGDEGHRVIPTDERPSFDDSAKFWFGVSRGRWEGDTLVVEVRNLNGLGWFDSTGQFYTENTRMTERFRLVDADTIDYEITIEDPTVYTRPWTMSFPRRRPGTGPNLRRSRLPSAVAINAPPVEDPYENEVWEEACYEGNGEGRAALHALGYEWFRGVTPPE
ncbi:MAG: hypothetical protein OEQ25_13010 [Gammaproteobacteria bacterium]|nr:hypothetical protein [Gammaproteobacteria bacterium]